MITDKEKSQIRAVLLSPQWKTVERVAEIIISEIKEDSNIRHSEYETLKTVFLNEGKRDGIQNFIKRLYNEIE